MPSRSETLTVGRPRRGPIGTVAETLASLVSRRRLLWYLTVNSLRRRGTDSVLGNLWWVLDPTLQIGIYFIFVGIILQRAQPAFPLFLFAAILPWRWFTSAITDATTSIRRRDKVMRQIAFPHIVLPASTVAGGTATFVFGLVPLAALYLFYPDRLTPWVLAIPLVAAVQLLWTIAFAILISAISVFFRDIQNLVGHLLRLWFYLSPGLYAAERLRTAAAAHPPADILVAANPFTWLFDAYRDLIYWGRSPDWTALLILGLAAIPFILVSSYIFRRLSRSFVKVL